jgi:putative secretion ATPase (PEP-CTERM system associated)
MYERFYNLRERPFALSPDPDYLYLSRVHREALDSIRYGFESRAGFTIITGEIGAGKTTLLQTILGRLTDRVVVARVVNTTLEPRELLEAILLEFGIDTTGKSKPVLLRDLGQALIRHRAEGRRALLVIDEAQNLSVQALEEVRLLSNLETEKSKLLQILLAGQPALRDTIASPELEQFRQRVAVSYHLTPLDSQETAAYINSRLAHAALGAPMRFPLDAALLVHERSGGVPRIINVISDAALIYGYAEGQQDIDLAVIREVVRELEATGVLRANEAASGIVAAAPETVNQPAPPQQAVPVAAAPVVRLDRSVRVEPLAPAPSPAVPRREAALAASALAAREQAVIERERELAQQRRVLAEEYRLLRERRIASSAPGAPGTRTAPPRQAAGVPVRFHAASAPESFGAWLKRLLSGVTHRAVQRNGTLHRG